MSDESAVKTYADYILPPSVVSKVDLSRLVNEVEALDSELTAISARAHVGVQNQPKPMLSEQLEDFLTQNSIALDDSRVRTDLIKQLRVLKDQVPVVHMTFAAAPGNESLRELAKWMRTEIHPQSIVAVGIQPSLVGGVHLRTPNHIHDFSLKALLKGHRNLLAEQLGALRGSK